jgi:hypothetical protein
VDILLAGGGLEAFIDHERQLIDGVLIGGLHILFGCR